MGYVFCHDRPARVVGLVVAITLAINACQPAAAQSNFGRVAATGDWSDSFWVGPSGGVGALPASGASPFIGRPAFPHSSALATATVDLTGTPSASAVTVGSQAGGTGTLVIQPGGALTALSLTLGSSGGGGTLTLSSGGALTVTNALTAGSSGGAATINLNGQTVSAGSYTQNGLVTLNRGAGGGLQAPNFNIAGGSFDLQTGDNFTVSGTVSGGAVVSNTVALNLSNRLDVSGSGSSYTASAPLTLGGLFTVANGAVFTANAQMTLGNATSQISSGSVFHANAPLTSATGLTVGSVGSTLNVNDNVSFGGNVSASGSGVINLNTGTLTANSLNIAFGAVINRTGGTYDVNGVSLANGASLSYQGSDDIANQLSLFSGAGFTLQKNLTLASSLSVDNSTLNLNGHLATVGTFNRTGAATVSRGAGGKIQGPIFDIDGGTPYVLDGTDSFTSSGSVTGGATVSNTVALNLSNRLDVSGSGSSYTAGAALTLGGSFTVANGAVFTANAQMTLGNATSQVSSGSVFHANAPLTSATGLTVASVGSTLNVNDNVSFGSSVSASGSGVINLNTGTLTANSLNIASGAVLNAQNNVGVSANLSIGAGTAVNVFQSLREGNGLTLQGNLTINPTGAINLNFDAGEGPGPIDFAFRWAGNHVSALTSLLGTRIAASSAPKPVSVIYDPAKYDDFTYIGFVPDFLGDLNADGDISAADYLTLSTNLLTNVSGMAALDSYFLGDLNGDRRINGVDYVAFRTTYDQVNGAGAFTAMLAAVPEPSSALLATFGLVITHSTGRSLWRRRFHLNRPLEWKNFC